MLLSAEDVLVVSVRGDGQGDGAVGIEAVVVGAIQVVEPAIYFICDKLSSCGVNNGQFIAATTPTSVQSNTHIIELAKNMEDLSLNGGVWIGSHLWFLGFSDSIGLERRRQGKTWLFWFSQFPKTERAVTS